MAQSVIDIDGAVLLSDITIKVTMPAGMKARLWAGALLFRIGAWVIGMGVTIDIGAAEGRTSTDAQ